MSTRTLRIGSEDGFNFFPQLYQCRADLVELTACGALLHSDGLMLLLFD